MIRRILPLVTLTVLFAFFAFARPAELAAQTAQQPKVAITGIAFLPSGCSVRVDCFEVKWTVPASTLLRWLNAALSSAWIEKVGATSPSSCWKRTWLAFN